MSYVVTRAGTFGAVVRTYTTTAGVPSVVIRWGPLGWVSPVFAKDVRLLKSRYEAEARAEAVAWLREQDPGLAS